MTQEVSQHLTNPTETNIGARAPVFVYFSCVAMNWKEHPFAVAATTCVATITVCATIVFTAVIPTWLRLKDNEIAIMQTQIGNLQTEPDKLKAQAKQLTVYLRTVESDNLKLRSELDKLSRENLFSPDNVYPRGFRSVRIGDRIDLISQAYADVASQIKDEQGWVSVSLKKPHPFVDVTYYYDEAATLKTIRFILFLFNNRDGKTFDSLRDQIIEAYGRTNISETTKHGVKQIIWTGIQNYTLTLGSNGTLAIEPAR